MGFVKQAKAQSMARDAQRALSEGHQVFVVQIRGAIGHSPVLSRPIQDVAEQIEAIEAVGWRLSEFTSVPFKNNMTTVCLFRPVQHRQPVQPPVQQPAFRPQHAAQPF